MYFLLNILGVLVVMGIVYLCSPNKRNVKWKAILTLLVLRVTYYLVHVID